MIEAADSINHGIVQPQLSTERLFISFAYSATCLCAYGNFLGYKCVLRSKKD